MIRSTLLNALATALALAVISGCAKDVAVAPAASAPAKLFEVPEAQRARLELVPVARHAITRPLRVPAVVAFDDLKTTDVVPLVTGRVEKVLVREGDKVRAGQPLLVIASADSSDNTANLKRDQAVLKNKQVVLARDEDLYQHKAISQEELQSAQLDVASAQATVEDDLEHVRIAGSGTGTGHALLKSPISGLVVARHVAVGEAVEAGGNAVFTVTDPSLVWVVAHVYQEDLRRVALGDEASIRSPVLDTPLEGKVTYIGASIDADTLTVPIRIETQNTKSLLKQGMYVDAAVAPAHTEDAQLLPSAAVLRDADNLPFVYVQAAPGQFARRHVELGDQVGDAFVIESGLKDGEQVLGSGALFIQFADSLEQ